MNQPVCTAEDAPQLQCNSFCWFSPREVGLGSRQSLAVSGLPTVCAQFTQHCSIFIGPDVIRRKALRTTTWVICRTVLQIAINTEMCYMHPTHNHLGYKQNSNLTNPNLCKSLHSLIRSIKLITHTNRHFTSKTI